MNSLLVVGECMMELVDDGNGNFARNFAGDTYNCGVYAKRFLPELEVGILTSVGNDGISNAMVAQFESEGIDCSHVLRIDNALPGIYAIDTDEFGEREFVYWRECSAAKQLLAELHRRGESYELPQYDYVYFSGLTLAIFNDEDKARLLELIAGLRERGATIVFDPNYRAAMWYNPMHAYTWLQRAYLCTDIALPGLQDHSAVFKQTDAATINQYLYSLGVQEVVVKGGETGVFAYQKGDRVCHYPFQAAPKQVDSTAAGDSFAGTYLAARISGSEIAVALASAAAVAGIVVQYPGAIVPKAQYQQHFCQQRSTGDNIGAETSESSTL